MGRPEVNKTAEVDAYMVRLDHPYRAEVQAEREIIKGVDPRITEQVKWRPSARRSMAWSGSGST